MIHRRFPLRFIEELDFCWISLGNLFGVVPVASSGISPGPLSSISQEVPTWVSLIVPMEFQQNHSNTIRDVFCDSYGSSFLECFSNLSLNSSRISFWEFCRNSVWDSSKKFFRGCLKISNTFFCDFSRNYICNFCILFCHSPVS